MIILVDQDGVLADIERAFLEIWRERYPNAPYVELEQRSTFYLEGEKTYRGFEQYILKIFTEEGFFANLEPVPGALEGIQKLIALEHEVLICSSPYLRSRYCPSEKYIWVEKYLGADFKKRLILSTDKTLVHGDLLIDDKAKIYGSRKPNWEHVVFADSRNRDADSSLRRITWETETWKGIIPGV